jgi:ADP-ribose pyrophosphatase YjhB (NUDIX family)
MQQRRRIGAYGFCRDQAGAVLLVRAHHPGGSNGRWSLPGGGVRHGEHPRDAVVREVREETGIEVAVSGVREVVTDVLPMPDIAAVRHLDRIIFDVDPVGGELRDEVAGTTDCARWVQPTTAAGLTLMPFAATALGLPSAVVDGLPDLATTVPSAIGRAHQRFAAYGLATDPAGRVLLALIADGYPGAGRWHLPGGGTDFGEPALAGLERELYEETGQVGHVDALVHVSHRRQHDVMGPEGVPIDWHGVRVVYRVRVDAPAPARVVEAAGGSTERSDWFEPAEALGLQLTEIAREMIEGHLIVRRP